MRAGDRIVFSGAGACAGHGQGRNEVWAGGKHPCLPETLPTLRVHSATQHPSPTLGLGHSDSDAHPVPLRTQPLSVQGAPRPPVFCTRRGGGVCLVLQRKCRGAGGPGL